MWKRLPFRLRGYLITVTGVLLLSPDALLVKDTTVDVATFMFWRGLQLGTVRRLIAALRYRERMPGAISPCRPTALLCSLAYTARTWAYGEATRLCIACCE